jgi:PAS domain S-box-containing protein
MELDFRKDPGILSTVIDAMAVGVFTVDSRGNFIAWSEGAERITGYPAADILKSRVRFSRGQIARAFRP